MKTQKATDQRKFDGRANYAPDDEVERLLQAHFDRYSVSALEVSKNFQIYVRRTLLKRFLAHYELFRMVSDLPSSAYTAARP
jgi:hypothetical protein